MQVKSLCTKCIILCYHSLVDKQYENRFVGRRRSITVETFEEQIKWLSQFAQFVSLQDLYTTNKSKKLQVIVTFDDGYKNNIELGYPLFEKYRIPVTWFVCPYFAENTHCLPWWDLLDFVTERLHTYFTVRIGEEHYSYNLSSFPERQRFIQEFGELFKNSSINEQSSYYAAIYNQIPKNKELPQNGFATISEIEEAAKYYWIRVGAHTLNHPNLVCCDPSEIQEEVCTSKEILQNITGQKVDWFAYPFGEKRHFNDNIKQVVKSAGFKGAVSTIPGFFDKKNKIDIYSIPRVPVQSGWDMSSFKFRVLHANLYRRLQNIKSRVKITS